jgi:membrane associated rhomboid family serine protease
VNYYRYQTPNYNYYRPRLFYGAIRSLVIANIAVFMLILLSRSEGFFLHYFGLVPRLIQRGYIWQLVTYLFIHSGFWHLFWNMFILWMFGSEVENYLGRRNFLKYYFITGIGSGLITFICSLNSNIPVVGASGAIYGILLAFGMLFPERYIYFYFLIPIKAKYFVWIIAAITFFSTLSPNISNISHLTHLGGLLVGYLYLKYSYRYRGLRFNYSLARLLSAIGQWWRRIITKIGRIWPKISRHRQRQTPKKTSSYATEETMREELDRILDQISRNGYDSLSEEEKTTLLLLSRYFADKDRSKN